MRIDLHTHSSASDGTDAPAELVKKAVAAGLDVLGLTDHDTYAGWEAASEAARGSGLVLILGVEISTRYAGVPVHVVAYLPDPTYQPLAHELRLVREDRLRRAQRTVEILNDVGLTLTLDEVYAQARDASSVGRPHIADALVERGYVANRAEAFTRWLAEGRPGYVSKYSPDTATAIRLVGEAGGVAVLAHPWGRGSRRVLDATAIAGLAATGLVGIEVDHEDHDPADRAALRSLAADLDLIVIGSSDYHGTGKIDHPLGVNTTAPEAYERLLDQARRAARLADRTTPEPVA